MGRLRLQAARWRRSLVPGPAGVACALAGGCLMLGLVSPPAGASARAPVQAASAGRSASAPGGGVIVSGPKPGSTADGPVELVLRDPDGMVSLQVNNQDPVLPPPSTSGLDSILVGPGQGLEPGANVLRVTDADGAGSETTLRFQVSRAVPVAGADDQTVAAGDPVVLDAGPSWGTAGGGALAYRWALKSAPPGDGVPASGTSRLLDLTPRLDGAVVYSLTVTERDTAGATLTSRADLVTVYAVPPEPLIPLDTQAFTSQGVTNGIKVGSVLYAAPASDNGQKPAVQVLAFARDTLEFESDVTVGCNEANQACADRIRAVLASRAGQLVIAAAHGGYTESATTLKAFTEIGASASAALHSDNSFTAVGVPGIGTGNGNQTGAADGNIRGFLTVDTEGHYGYVAGQPAVYDTRAPGSTDLKNIIQVGGSSYTATVPAGTGGFQLVIVNRVTLKPAVEGTYVTAGRPDSVQALNHLANDLNTRAGLAGLVFLTSIGSDTSGAWDGPTSSNSALQGLGDAIQALGGSVNTVVRLRAGDNYSFVGYRGLAAGQGIEASGVISAAEEAARIQGVLTRDSNDDYLPTISDFAPQASFSLQQIAYQNPSAWPLTSTAADRAAVAWVSRQVLGSGDLRSAYWLNDTWSSARWGQIRTDIAALTFPGGEPGFTPAELDAAKAELRQEIAWVIVVRDYFENLAKPYSDSGLMSYTALIDMQNKLNDAIKPPANNTTLLNWLSAAGEIAALVPGVGGFYKAYEKGFKVVSVLVTSYKAGVAIYRAASGKPLTPEDLRVKADTLATTFSDSLRKGRAGIFRLQAIILGDYGKLKAVGTDADCDKSGADCPPEWQLSQASLDFATRNQTIQARQSFASALFPMKFQARLVTGSNRLLYAQDYWCESSFTVAHPFGSEPANAQYSFASYDSSGTIQYNRIYALAEPGNNNGPQLPNAALVNSLFDPVNFDQPTTGPLGMIRPRFFLQSYPSPVRQSCSLPTQDSYGYPEYTSIAAQLGGNPVAGALWIQRDDSFWQNPTQSTLYYRGLTLDDGTPREGIAGLPGAIVADPVSSGHWVVTYNGDILAFGKAEHFACTKLSQCSNYKGTIIRAAAATPDGKGLWILGQGGQVWTVGNAPALGDAGLGKNECCTVAIVADPTGFGYTILRDNGDVYAKGNARNFGSTSGKRPRGYSASGLALSIGSDGKPNGYWMVFQDGGVFTYPSSIPFYGSTGGNNGGSPVVGITALPKGGGYVIVHLNGKIDRFLKK